MQTLDAKKSIWLPTVEMVEVFDEKLHCVKNMFPSELVRRNGSIKRGNEKTPSFSLADSNDNQGTCSILWKSKSEMKKIVKKLDPKMNIYGTYKEKKIRDMRLSEKTAFFRENWGVDSHLLNPFTSK